jgi:signal transduction histidine kinase
MTISFAYDKKQVLQALRYHFISRPEIKTMLIVVNVFALISITLYAMQKITATAFLVSSGLWIVLMISFWFILPGVVYKRNETFRHGFTMHFDEDDFTLAHENGQRKWPWKALNTFLESPHFFHLYFDSRSFFLVPKSGCKDKVFELRQLLKEKIKRKL